MGKNNFTTCLITGLFLSVFTCQYSLGQIKDYLGLPGPITYDSIDYNLAWTSNPSKGFFVQEYMPTGSDTNNFSKMILVDVLIGNISIAEAVGIKMRELEKRKKIDAVVNYKLFNNPDKTEYLLDFILSEGNPTLSLVEWNAYRYRVYKDESGRKGILLFGLSFREKGEIRKFLTSLSELRKKQIKALEDFQIPLITIKNY